VDSNFLQLRHRIISWIADLNEKFEFSTETLFLSVAVFDRFLVSVKVGHISFRQWLCALLLLAGFVWSITCWYCNYLG